MKGMAAQNERERRETSEKGDGRGQERRRLKFMGHGPWTEESGEVGAAQGREFAFEASK